MPTPDNGDDDTGAYAITHVEWHSDSVACAPGQFEFRTFDVTSNGTNLVNTIKPEAFFFIIP